MANRINLNQTSFHGAGAIKEYIQNQLQEDIMHDQISLKEFVDPFTGESVKQGR